MQQKPGLDWAPVLGFTEEPQLDVDFVTPLYWFEKHPASNMNKVPRVSYYTEDGILAIRAAAGSTKTRRLIERAGIIVDALDITSVEQEKTLIQEVFGLPTDY